MACSRRPGPTKPSCRVREGIWLFAGSRAGGRLDTRSATGLGLALGMYGGGEGAASGLAARVCLKTAELECQAEGGGVLGR